MTECTHQAPLSPETAAGLQVTLRPARAYRHVETIVLRQGLYAIGAAVDADVVIPVGGVQRQHCRIEVDDDVATLTADSRMTWINDQPVDCRDLCDKDRLAIGPVEFVVEISHFDSQPPAAPQAPHALQPEEFDELLHSGVEQVNGTEHTAAPTGAAPDPTAAELAAARQRLAEHEAKLSRTEQLVGELEERRRQLQSVVDDLLNEAARQREQQQQQEQQQRRQREHLARLENEASVWRASLVERDRDIEQLREELERRFSALQHVEAEIQTQSQQLEKASEELTVHRHDQSEREALLQARLEELGHSEATFNERDAELARRAVELDQRAEDLARQSEDLQQQMFQIEEFRREVQAAARADAEELSRQEAEQVQLREQLALREAELTTLRSRLDEQDVDDEERQSRLCERESEIEELAAQVQARLEELEQREIDLQVSHSGIEDHRREIAERQATLDEQQQCLEQERALVLREAEELAAERQALESQHRQQQTQTAGDDVAAQREELAREREELQHLRVELQQQQDELDLQLTSVTAQRQECRRLQEELEADRGALQAARNEIDLHRQQISGESSELEGRRAELHQRLAAVKAWRNDLRLQARQIEQAAQTVAAGSALAEHESELTAREARLERREAALSAMKTELHDLGTALNRREQEVKAREAAVVQSQLSVAARDADVQKTWAEIAESRAQLDRQREEFGARFETLSRDRQALREDQQSMDVLRVNLQEKQRELEEERRRCRQQLANVDMAEQKQESELRNFAAARDNWQRERTALVGHIGALAAELGRLRGGDSDSGRTEAAGGDLPTSSCETEDCYAIASDVEEGLPEEIVDVAATDEEVPEAILGLRAQMAAAFGLQLDASRVHTDYLADSSAGIEETPGHSGMSAAPGNAAECGEAAPAATDVPPQHPESFLELAADQTIDTGVEQTRENEEAELHSEVEDSAAAMAEAVAQANLIRRQAQLESERERQNLNSLREVANLSARSALARHASTELKNTLLVQGIVTGVFVAAAIVLLASPMWSSTSRIHWGILTALASGVLVWQTLQTTARMQNHRSAGKSRKRCEKAESADAVAGTQAADDPEELDEDATKLQPAEEAVGAENSHEAPASAAARQNGEHGTTGAGCPTAAEDTPAPCV